MTASEAVPVPEEHPLGGMTRAEALKVYDVGAYGASTADLLAEVKEIGRRVTYELDQLTRAEDYPGVLKFVKETEGFITEPQGEELAFALENLLDRLERGDSEALENFAEWRKELRWRKTRKKKDLLLLTSAADSWYEELKHRIDSWDDMTRPQRARWQAEMKRLAPAVDRAWKKVQS